MCLRRSEFFRQFCLEIYLPCLSSQNVQEILNIYEVEFNKLSDRWFTEDPWPEAERVAPLVGNGRNLFLPSLLLPPSLYSLSIPPSSSYLPLS